MTAYPLPALSAVGPFISFHRALFLMHLAHAKRDVWNKPVNITKAWLMIQSRWIAPGASHAQTMHKPITIRI